jgi:macrolide transport system ATP-binding/permease protein
MRAAVSERPSRAANHRPLERPLSLTSLAHAGTQLSLHEVTKTVDHRVILDRVTCSFTPGAVTGVIGENGSGKSTLLRLLAAVDTPDDGRIVALADGGLALLEQDSPLPRTLTVRDVIDLGLAELRKIEARLRALEQILANAGDAETESLHSTLTEYSAVQDQFESREGYDAEARLQRALAGLGLVHLPEDRRLEEMSGGERVRLHLASVLAASPEVLLLDEPTNHLDVRATQWLEAHLVARRGTTVVVSHDRVFLNHVSDVLFEVDGDTHRVACFTGGYDGYLATKAADRARWVQARLDWENEVEHLREAGRTRAQSVAPGRARTDGNKMAYDRAGGRVQASESSRVRNVRQRLRRLEDRPVPIPPDPIRFTVTLSGGRLGATVFQAVDVGVTGRLAPTSLTLAGDGRLLVTGPNGAGKTTLLDLLAGTEAPDTGTLARHGRIAHLPQETGFDPTHSVLQAFAAGRSGPADEHETRLRSLGLLPADRHRALVSSLSAGQRRRLALARLVTEPADVLLLDEPFNHVSLTLVEELETALAHYAGAIVVVTHDRRFQQRWQGDVLHLPGPSGPSDPRS